MHHLYFVNIIGTIIVAELSWAIFSPALDPVLSGYDCVIVSASNLKNRYFMSEDIEERARADSFSPLEYPINLCAVLHRDHGITHFFSVSFAGFAQTVIATGVGVWEVGFVGELVVGGVKETASSFEPGGAFIFLYKDIQFWVVDAWAGEYWQIVYNP